MACRPFPNLCFANPRPARPNPNKHTQRNSLTRSTLNVSQRQNVIAHKHRNQLQPQRKLKRTGGGGPEKSLRAPSTVCCLRASPCCGWPPRCGSPRSATCPWPCRCCRSCPGPERGGRASQSPTPEGPEEAVGQDNGRTIRERRGEERLSWRVYLRVKLADVIALLTEVEELKKKKKKEE